MLEPAPGASALLVLGTDKVWDTPSSIIHGLFNAITKIDEAVVDAGTCGSHLGII